MRRFDDGDGPADIIEALIDPLMVSDLAEGSPSASIERLSENQIRLDLGVAETVFSITVEAHARP